MTDKQQIEEMAKDTGGCEHPSRHCEKCWMREQNECYEYICAKALYNANYRQVPPNAVVLTREEYEWYRKQCEELNNIYSNGFRTLTEVHKLLEQTRKETAKEILQEVGKACGDYQWFKNLCKQFGVEVEV